MINRLSYALVVPTFLHGFQILEETVAKSTKDSSSLPRARKTAMAPFKNFFWACMAVSSVSAAPIHNRDAPCPTPTVNDATVNLLKESEGESPTPYVDSVGKWTIGIGHLCDQTQQCKELPYPIPLSNVRPFSLYFLSRFPFIFPFYKSYLDTDCAKTGRHYNYPFSRPRNRR